MKEGWLRQHGSSEMQRKTIAARQFEMIPTIEEKVSEGETDDGAKTSDVEKWYSIDNDNYEVKPIRVTLLPQAIKVFGTSSRR